MRLDSCRPKGLCSEGSWEPPEIRLAAEQRGIGWDKTEV